MKVGDIVYFYRCASARNIFIIAKVKVLKKTDSISTVEFIKSFINISQVDNTENKDVDNGFLYEPFGTGIQILIKDIFEKLPIVEVKK